MKKLRGLCIGAGYFSQFHLDAWRRIPEVEIVGICDRDQEKARRAAQSPPPAGWGRGPRGGDETEQVEAIRVFRDAAEAMDSLQPDFVDIITPPPAHLELVEQAATRKLAIICQKPLAPDFATACNLVDYVERANVPFMVHENFRFQPWHREIKRLLVDGAIGHTLHNLHFRTRTGDGWGPGAYLNRQPYFRDMPRLLVHETGVHFIDTFRFLAGEIDEVYAILRRLNPVIRGEDAGLVTFRFASGCMGVWDANRCNDTTAADPRYTLGEFLVEGDEGTIRLYPDGRLTLQPLGEAEREHPYHHERRGFAGDCVYFTQRHFVERLLAGEPFETGGREYLTTLAVQEACYRSAEENRPVGGLLSPNAALEFTIRRGAPGALSANMSHGARRIVDLSLPISNDLRGVCITTARTIAADGWNATTLSLYSHCGTHMDAPRHFLEGAATIDEQDLGVCCGPALVLDLTPVEPRELLTVDRLTAWASRIGQGSRLLLRTDWHKRLGTDEYRDGLPRISAELARWFVERRVALVGVEPPSVADVNNIEELTEVHQILFRGNVLIVEGLAGLDQLHRDEVEFIALPLRVTGGDGTPVRAVAIDRTTL